MSHTWLVRLPSRTDDRSRVDDAACTAGLRGGVVAEKPIVALGDSRLDCARLDPEDRRHSAAVERSGIVRSMRVGGLTGSGVERYQLHTESQEGKLEPVNRAWRQFEFIPKQQAGAVLIAQMGSPNLLYSTLPTDPAETGSMVFLFASHNAAVSAFAVDATGTTVVSGAEDGSLAVWQVSDGSKVGGIAVAHEGGVRAVAIASPTCVISAGNDGNIRIWQVSSDPRLRMLHKLTTGPAPVTALAVWSGPGDESREPGAPMGQLGHGVLKTASLAGVVGSGSGGKGRLLAAGTEDGTVYSWTAEAVPTLQDFAWRAKSVSHHMTGMQITYMSFRGDGAALVVGGSEPHHTGKGEARLFETEHWTSVANTSYSSGVVGCEYIRSPLLVDLAMLCSAAGAPRLLEARLVPAVTAPLREKGMGAEIPPQPLGHGPLPAAAARDGLGIRIVTDGFENMDVAESPSAEQEPRADAPPTPASKTKGDGGASRSRGRPEGVLRPAFSRSGKYHVPPETTPSQRATRAVSKMAADAMAKAPVMPDENDDDDDEFEQDPEDVLGGVDGAETALAKPSLMSSRPLLHRNALIPFAVFDKEAELEHHMAPLGIKGRKEAAAVADTHVRAMAAANMDLTLPRNGRRFEGLIGIQKEAPAKAKRIVGKQLDARWLAVRDIRPRIEDMWVAARREPQVCSTEGWSPGTLLNPPSEGVEF